MSFNSVPFLILLLITVAMNYLLPQRMRPLLLLCASAIFISSHHIGSFLAVVISSLITFFIALKVKRSRFLYITGILLHAAAIILFNYFQAGYEFKISPVYFDVNRLVVAVGLSFYSLQHIAYLTELRSGRRKAEQDLMSYVLYGAFFPRIISGPVMLPDEFLPQVSSPRISREMLQQGFNRFLMGLFKKMAIADRIAPAVHSVFDHGEAYSGLTTISGFYLFTIQLYFDFSAYSDMAIGAGKMLGIDLKENFQLPLRSGSVTEFWRRWHISLISWFSTYIYYPLVYRLRSYKKTGVLLGIAATFLVSAVWHGIGMTFLTWAACHVVYLYAELISKGARIRLSEKMPRAAYRMLSVLIVISLVSFSNVFFRADSMSTAMTLLHNASSSFIPEEWLGGFIAPLAQGGHQLEKFNLFVSLFFIAVFLLFEKRINGLANTEKLSIPYICILILLIFTFGIFDGGERFIYMQF